MPSYELRWAASLLRRDIHDLATKVKDRLSSTKSARTSSPPLPEKVVLAVDEPGRPRSVNTVAETAESVLPSTLYKVLEGRLKALYAARDPEMSHQERFHFRGSWLVLWMALQACPSNDAFDIFRCAKLNDSAHVLELLQKYDCAATTSSMPQQVSKMPAAPYEGTNNHSRIDSAISNVFGAAPGASPPTTSELWYDILEGASDASKIALIAERLLGCVWPDKDALEILHTIGHPGKKFDSEDDLRLRLRDLLFPGYNGLVSLPQL